MKNAKPNAPPAKAEPKARSVYVTMSPPSTEGSISILELWNALFDGKWIIVGLTALFTISGIAYSLMATPVYRSEVVLAPVTKSGMGSAAVPFGGLASLAGINLGGGTDRTETIALLESSGFAEAFIREKQLLPILFADRWDTQAQKWKAGAPAEQPDIRDGVKYFNEAVRFVSEDDPKTGLVTLAVEWTDPEIAAAWVRELVHRINEGARRRDIHESQRKLDYLNQEMSKANLVELRQALSRLIEEQINAMMMAQAQEEYAFKVIDPPVVPKQRIWPKATLVVLVAMFLGGFVGTLVVLIRFALRRMSGSVPA
jgi:uncharacterized protein involved in exopolysaccharide biosynthesis